MNNCCQISIFSHFLLIQVSPSTPEPIQESHVMTSPQTKSGEDEVCQGFKLYINFISFILPSFIVPVWDQWVTLQYLLPNQVLPTAQESVPRSPDTTSQSQIKCGRDQVCPALTISGDDFDNDIIALIAWLVDFQMVWFCQKSKPHWPVATLERNLQHSFRF